MARRAGLATASVDYHLAPQHPYPAGPDDCEAAARWLIVQAENTFGTKRLTLGGDSAGAQLAVVTLLRLRESGLGAAFCGVNLAFGQFDLTLTPSVLRAEDSILVNRRAIEASVTAFAPATSDRRNPDLSPIYANLHGLPPALFTVGTLDPLLDDSLFMYARWLAAGNSANLAIYPGGIHGFTLLEGGLAPEANERIDRFLAAV